MVQTRWYKRIRGDSNAPRPCIGHAMEATSSCANPSLALWWQRLASLQTAETVVNRAAFMRRPYSRPGETGQHGETRGSVL